MKTCILLLMGGFLLLFACQSAAKIEVQTQRRVETTGNLDVNIARSIFTSANPETGKSCDILNAKVRNLIDSIEKKLALQADTFYSGMARDGMVRPAWNFEFYADDSVFMVHPDYISLRVRTYIFQGGAHGMTEFYAFNYDVKRRQLQSPTQILDFRKYREINEILKKNFTNPDHCFTEIPTLENGFTALNLSAEAVCLTYPQYVLGPYSCGYAQVNLPRAELKDILLNK
ncbi:MAG: DUF4163 domain-containing protein [Odoribacter sp.]|nr:DUF4163 domain-containing protein [Odoribacter sp.]